LRALVRLGFASTFFSPEMADPETPFSRS